MYNIKQSGRLPECTWPSAGEPESVRGMVKSTFRSTTSSTLSAENLRPLSLIISPLSPDILIDLNKSTTGFDINLED